LVIPPGQAEIAVPKPTFYNLAAERRARIIDAALNEFAAHPLQSASVNRVVKAAGIAKGSFYQYFADLEDLYRYLVFEYGVERKMASMKGVGAPPAGGDLFDTMTFYAVQGLRFGVANPRLAAATRHLTSGLVNDSLAPAAQELKRRSRVGTRHILSEGMVSGAIRPDLDLDTAVIFTEQCLRTTLDEVFRSRFGVDLLELCSEPDRAAEITDEQLYEAVGVVIDFLRRAIGSGQSVGADLDLDRLRASVGDE
jgi:AcrR family transcriptional regulator